MFLFLFFWPCVPSSYNLISIKKIQLYAHWFSPTPLFLSCGVRFHFGIHHKYWWKSQVSILITLVTWTDSSPPFPFKILFCLLWLHSHLLLVEWKAIVFHHHQCFFFLQIFATWQPQKKDGKSNKGIFEIKFFFAISWRKKLRSCQIFLMCYCRSP